MLVKLAELLSIRYPATAFEVGSATYAVWEEGNCVVDDDEGDEPHPVRAANPRATKIRDAPALGIIALTKKVEVLTDLSNMASEVSRFGNAIPLNSKFGTPANMAVVQHDTG